MNIFSKGLVLFSFIFLGSMATAAPQSSNAELDLVISLGSLTAHSLSQKEMAGQMQLVIEKYENEAPTENRAERLANALLLTGFLDQQQRSQYLKVLQEMALWKENVQLRLKDHAPSENEMASINREFSRKVSKPLLKLFNSQGSQYSPCVILEQALTVGFYAAGIYTFYEIVESVIQNGHPWKYAIRGAAATTGFWLAAVGVFQFHIGCF